MKASPWDNRTKEPCPRTQRSGHGRIRTEDHLIRNPTLWPIGHCASSCVGVCVCVCQCGYYEGLSRCRFVCSCGATCKTTFARLTQSQAISQSFHVFIHFRSTRDPNKFHCFFSFFEIHLYTPLTFRSAWLSTDSLVENLQVAVCQLRNPPV